MIGSLGKEFAPRILGMWRLENCPSLNADFRENAVAPYTTLPRGNQEQRQKAKHLKDY